MDERRFLKIVIIYEIERHRGQARRPNNSNMRGIIFILFTISINSYTKMTSTGFSINFHNQNLNYMTIARMAT
jgi:hypothetical protein